MGFELLMNGVGDAFSRQSWGTNFLCRKDGYLLAVDCPDSYRRALVENGFEHEGEPLDADAIDGLVLTHLHGDHVNGLEMLLAYRRYVVGEPLDIYTTNPVADVLWERRLGVALGRTWNGERYECLGPEDYFSLHRLPWEEESSVGPFRIEPRQTVHHIPTSALRISDGDVTVGYSCDTEFDEELIDWLADSDQILHETSYGPGHTPLFELEELPSEVRDKVIVVHIPDDLWEVEDEVEPEFASEGEIYAV